MSKHGIMQLYIWDTFIHCILQMRLSMWNNGIEKMFIEFNSTGSNITEFFDQSRIINSPFTDLTTATTPTFFNITG